jgi:uncharacterized caspase-like protein
MDLVSRRRFLQGGIVAGSLFLPAPYAWVWAQSEGAVKLLRLPKVALVFGNSAYKRVAILKNPANDATAMAAALRESGFEVTMRLDASQKEMREAFEAHARTLATKKCVGLVYFAGHGFQMAWRNYLVPVEAGVEKVEDVAARCVDIGGLFDLIAKSGNPMNVIILDACRDNPFSTDFRLTQAGLSQMDAPPATLLAYATAPGNTASDGEGANGLYTTNLLREMKVSDAKIEDVFKRVRLGVRRASNGAQIPWESTSLEEDFYFKPPEQLRKLSQEEEERQFREEEALFEKVRQSRSAQLAEDYLRRYPSGRFTELAQLSLDTLLAAQGEKRVEVISAKDNPNTAGFARADTNFRIGDRYVYRRFNRKPRGDTTDFHQVVTSITDDEVIFSNGLYTTDLLGNTRKLPDGRRYTTRQDLPLEYQVGKRWTTRFEVSGRGAGASISLDYRVVAREKVTVPAGTFDCFRIEGTGTVRQAEGGTEDFFLVQWRTPEVRRPVAGEERRRRLVKGHVSDYFEQRNELLSFRQG